MMNPLAKGLGGDLMKRTLLCDFLAAWLGPDKVAEAYHSVANYIDTHYKVDVKFPQLDMTYEYNVKDLRVREKAVGWERNFQELPAGIPETPSAHQLGNKLGRSEFKGLQLADVPALGSAIFRVPRLQVFVWNSGALGIPSACV